MPNKTYEDNVKKIINAIEDYKKSSEYKQKEVELLELEVKSQQKTVDDLKNIAHEAATTDIVYGEKLLEAGDKLRELQAKLEERKNVEKELESKKDNLDKYISNLESKKDNINTQIKEGTAKIKEIKEKLDELKKKEDKTEEDLAKINELADEKQEIFSKRKELREELGEINKALKVSKDYQEKGIVPEEKQEINDETEKKGEKPEDKKSQEEQKKEDKGTKQNEINENDPVLEKYRSEGFGKNAFGWYFNPGIDEFDPEYDPHNDEEYNKELSGKKIKWHPKLTQEQIDELIAEGLEPGDNQYDMYLLNHGINPKDLTIKQKMGPVKIDQFPRQTSKETAKEEKGQEDNEEKKTEEFDIKKDIEEIKRELEEDKKEEKTDRFDIKKDIEEIKRELEEDKQEEKTEDPKIEIKDLYISPIEETIEASWNNLKEQSFGMNYEKATQKETIQFLKALDYDIDKIKGAIDPNICEILYSKEGKEGLDKYIDFLHGENSNLSLTYDLKDMRKSGLSRKEIKNLYKIAKQAQKLNPRIEVQKDNNVVKRAFSWLSRGLGQRKEQKKLPEGTVENKKRQDKSFVPQYSDKVQVMGREFRSCQTRQELKDLAIKYREQVITKDEVEYINNIIREKQKAFEEGSSVKKDIKEQEKEEENVK